MLLLFIDTGSHLVILAMPLFGKASHMAHPDNHVIEILCHAERLGIQWTPWAAQQVHDAWMGAFNLFQPEILLLVCQECFYVDGG